MIRKALKAFAFASVLVGSGSALAAIDGKGYNPAFCTNGLLGASYTNATHQVFPWQFANFSGGTMIASCPIEKDNESSTTGLNFSAIYVSNPSGQTTSCTIYSNDIFGGTVDWRQGSTASAGNQAIYLTQGSSSYPNTYVKTSATWGNYGIICNLPNNGAIRSYVIFEN